MKIIETNHWDADDVRCMCIRNDLYTHGTNRDYEAMFDIVRSNPHPTLDNIYQVADDINRHSEDQTITNIMFLLSNSVVRRFYDIED